MSAGFNSTLGKVEFLNLLAVQLQYQDPLSPVDQESFISQLSQFSTLEGVEKLNSSFENILAMEQISQGANLVGKRVGYFDSNTGEAAEGLVEQIAMSNGEPILTVNGEPVHMSQVTAIMAPKGQAA
jgi:flagellar basal-body rod modification protein FlgD